MSDDKTEGVLGGFLWALLFLTLLLFIPVIGPIILITLSLIVIIYAFIESISKRIKSSNRRREMLLNEKQKELDFRESGDVTRNAGINPFYVGKEQVEITGSTKESNIIPKQQKNRKKFICKNCGALFEEYSYNCAYCGSDLKIKKFKGIKKRLL